MNCNVVTCQGCKNLETNELVYGERNEYRDDTHYVNLNTCDNRLTNGVNDLLDITALRICEQWEAK